MQCTTSCCDRASELQPDNVAQGDLGMKGNSNSIMKPKKNPALFNGQELHNTEGKFRRAELLN